MAIKLAGAALAVVVLVALLQGSLFGGSDETTGGSSGRSGSIPTATPPTTLPTPILLGQARTGTTGAATAGSGTYTIKSGDTLDSIAASFSVPPEQRAAW